MITGKCRPPRAHDAGFPSHPNVAKSFQEWMRSGAHLMKGPNAIESVSGEHDIIVALEDAAEKEAKIRIIIDDQDTDEMGGLGITLGRRRLPCTNRTPCIHSEFTGRCRVRT